ncbi:MAG: metallophosphoesterase, partial [bacterium]|nr:metallophosphoesterase [bacterium]
MTRRLLLIVTAAFVGLVIVIGYPLALSDGDAQSVRQPFRVVLIPDTQQYTELDPEMFYAQTKWIVGTKKEKNIVFAIGLGDIVQTDAISEWESASQAYNILETGDIPYSVAVGNHDLGLVRGTVDRRDASRFNIYFGSKRFEDKSWYGGHFGEGNENNYTFFNAGDLEFLVVTLEFGPRDEVLQWANDLIASYPEKRVIVATHSYLCYDNTRVGSVSVPTGQYH